jgi:YfiH family protein
MALPLLITSEKLSGIQELRFGQSTRNGGVSPEPYGMNTSFRVGDEADHVKANRKKLLSLLGIARSEMAVPVQCHSDVVQIARHPGEYPACDGLVTDQAGLALAISVADCLPIVIYDALHRAVALVHAGWRGSAKGIARHAVQVMVREFQTDVARLAVYLGPSASVCCYEVGPEVAKLFPLECVDERKGRLYLNLKEANRRQLLDLGVEAQNLEVSSYCTICEPRLFHSYRRDKERSGRMMAVACITN